MYRNQAAAEEYIKLRKSYMKLMSSLDVKSDLLARLYEEAVINEDDFERIGAKETSKDKANELLMMIQKRYLCGFRPYEKFLQALTDCDQQHLRDMLERCKVKESDHEKYRDAFLPPSEESSTTPGSPRRSFYPFSDSKIRKDLDNVLRHLNEPSKNTSSGNQDYPYHSNNRPVHHNTSRSTEVLPTTCNCNHRVMSTNNDSIPLNYEMETRVAETQTIPSEKLDLCESRRNGLYQKNETALCEATYMNSPHRKCYRIDNKTVDKNHIGTGKVYAWVTDDPGQNPRFSKGFEMLLRHDHMYQSLPSIYSPASSLLDPQPQKLLREDRLTNREQRMEVNSGLCGEPSITGQQHSSYNNVLKLDSYTQTVSSHSNRNTCNNNNVPVNFPIINNYATVTKPDRSKSPVQMRKKVDNVSSNSTNRHTVPTVKSSQKVPDESPNNQSKQNKKQCVIS